MAAAGESRVSGSENTADEAISSIDQAAQQKVGSFIVVSLRDRLKERRISLMQSSSGLTISPSTSEALGQARIHRPTAPSANGIILNRPAGSLEHPTENDYFRGTSSEQSMFRCRSNSRCWRLSLWQASETIEPEITMKSNWYVLPTLLLTVMGVQALRSSHAEEEKILASVAMVAVESDVHEFMEYAFEPFFHSLKESLAHQPADKKAWKPIKANSLILAENGNLLMLRGPEEDKAAWNALAAKLREEGKLLYQSAKKRDYELARRHYVNFVTSCNACHEKFADGEHIQTP